METVIVQKALEVIYNICLIWDDLRHLPSICSFLAKHMNQDVIVNALSLKKQNSSLQILSNDIPSDTLAELEGGDELQDEKDGINIVENNSDDDNDWDDSDGDADVHINISEIVRFLNKLKVELSSK